MRKPELGLTLIEILIALLILGIVVGATLSVVVTYQRYIHFSNARIAVSNQANAVYRILSEDLTTAGKSTTQDIIGARNLVKDPTLKSPVPSAYIGDEGKSLTIIQTTPNDTGRIALITGSKLTIYSVEPGPWTQLQPLTVVMVINPTGNPCLFKLSSVPYPATDVDLPAEPDSDLYRKDHAIVLVGAPTDACGLVNSLSTSVQIGAVVTPVQGFVKYFTEAQNGLIREEYPDCSTEVTPENRVILSTLAMSVPTTFTYLTSTGTSTTLPTDLTTLQGIQAQIHLRNPNANVSLDKPFEIYVKEWLH